MDKATVTEERCGDRGTGKERRRQRLDLEILETKREGGGEWLLLVLKQSGGGRESSKVFATEAMLQKMIVIRG